MPDIEAPEGSVVLVVFVGGCGCLGCVPDVEGVGDGCGELGADERLELVSGGVTGAGGAAGGTTGCVGTCADAGVGVSVGPSGCNLGIDVQLY